MPCPYRIEHPRLQGQDGNVRCGWLCGRCAFTVSVEDAICAACEIREGWKDESSMRPLLVTALRGRLGGGLAPRYQIPNPFDQVASFATLVQLVGKPEAQKVLDQMYWCGARLTEAEGGLRPAELATQLSALSDAHGLSLAVATELGTIQGQKVSG